MGKIIRVPIAGAGVGSHGDTLFTVVGSCVAIMLFDKKHHIGGMVHIMLGYSNQRKDNPAKYADTAIPYLIRLMAQRGAAPHRLVGAKISGGGEMFPVANPEQSVSRNNVKAVKALLAEHKIRVISEDTGGKTGRRISFDLVTGRVMVSMQGEPDKIL